MKKNGFTFIELLVVVTIIALLTGIGAVSYSVFLKQSRDAIRKADLDQIRAALEMYRSNNSEYPAFTGNCSESGFTTTMSEYLSSIPSDPKTDYHYYCTVSATTYTISAAMEMNASPSCSSDTACGIKCGYSVGPYGQTCP